MNWVSVRDVDAAVQGSGSEFIGLRTGRAIYTNRFFKGLEVAGGNLADVAPARRAIRTISIPDNG